MTNTGRNPKLEHNLYRGGWFVGNAIGWALEKMFESRRRAKEDRLNREARRPSNTNRKLPDWQMDVCERAVKKLLTHLTGTVGGTLEEPARQLCYDILLFEDKHKTVYIKKLEHFLSETLWNLIGERVDTPLIGGATGEKIFSIPVHALHSNVAEFIDVFASIIKEEILPPDGRPFTKLMAKYQYNLFKASGIDPDRYEGDPGKFPILWAKQVKGKSVPELIDTYLRETPLPRFFNTSLPVSIPRDTRFEHMHIVGGSGHGKTQLLQTFILHDLQKLREGERSVIVIDSQGDLIRNIEKLAILEAFPDRVVNIDPREIATPPALNLFDLGLDRITAYSPLEQEMLLNGAIEMYKYMFGALFGADLTMRQGTLFSYLASLMMLVPNATIKTFMGFLQQPERTRPYLSRLKEDSAVRVYLETEFFAKDSDHTRREILNRLWGVIAIPTLDRMFSNERNKLDLFSAMNRGSLILINTAKDLLKQEGTEILGRFFIALICQAAQERASIAERERMPTFVYIDEAHDYFDANLENMFNQMRKYAVGLCIAHQNLDQFKPALRSTVNSSTAIKLVGGLSAKDADFFAENMKCKQELLLSMRKYDDRSEFACFVRNFTKSPIALTVPFGTMEKEPKLSAGALEAIKAQSRERYCTSLAEHTETERPPKGINGHQGLDKPPRL